MSTHKQDFIDAVERASAARHGDSNDEEIEALWEAVDLAIEWFSHMDLISVSEYDLPYGELCDEH